MAHSANSRDKRKQNPQSSPLKPAQEATVLVVTKALLRNGSNKPRKDLGRTRADPVKGGFWREVQHLRALGLTKERSDFPFLAAAFRCISKMRRRLRGKQNRVGSKRWGVALRVGIQEGMMTGVLSNRSVVLSHARAFFPASGLT